MKRLLAILAASVLLLPLAVKAQPEEGYDSRSYVRLSYISGEVNVQRAGDMGYEAGTVNLALISGDKLSVQEGRAEVSLGRQNYVRLDRLSQIELTNLPGQGDGSYKIHLLGGHLYLRVSRMDRDKEFEVHTPDASFYVLDTGLYRLDVLDRGETRLSVVEGTAEAAGETGSLEVRSGQSLGATNGRLMSNLENLLAQTDDFSRWNQSRDSLLASRGSNTYLPQELGEYGSELDEYGDWHYEPDYGYVWVPEVDYYRDWHPYYYGHWVWYPIIGWTWIPDEPWGWCVYHYGRWHWRLNLGWYWIPTRYWGPAWVDWYWGNDYLGWCPLNYWNRPVVVVNNIFYNDYNRSYYPIENRALTVISRNQLQARRISDVALRGGALERIGRVSLSGRQPSIRPTIMRSGRAYDQARRTFEQSGGRTVGRVYSRGLSGGSQRLPGSVQERNLGRPSSSQRTFGNRGVSTSRRLPNSESAGSPSRSTVLSSRRITEFSSSRSGIVPFRSRSSSADSGRSLRSTPSRRSTLGSASSTGQGEFSSRYSSRRTVSSDSLRSRLISNGSSSRSSALSSTRGSALNREFSPRLSSSSRRTPFSSGSNLPSSGRTSSWSSRIRSQSSVRSSNRSTASNYFSSGRSEPTLRRSNSWPSAGSSSRGSSFFNRSSSSSPRSFSSSSRSYSSPRPSSSSSSPSFSSRSRSSSPSSHSFSSSHRSTSSSSSSGHSSSGGSRIRRRSR